MLNFNRLYITLSLIRHALVPQRNLAPVPLPQPGNGTASIPPEAFAAVLGHLAATLRPDGSLDLLFSGALAPAAPFLLFRLKRHGYSACRAVITPQGIMLSARR
jgi:hypothetical protein